jgi:mRNA-degrading endonuclease toxin of MazEF toxin-antitoxin module
VAAGTPGGTTPARGQVWHSDQVFSGEPADFLIISSDEWNRRGVDSVLGMEVVQGHDGEINSFTSLITAGGRPMTVYGDQIYPVPKAGLVDRGIELDAAAMADINRTLDRALSTATTRPPAQAVLPRPAGHPYRGHLRFADLQIPGEKDKPVVVVSSETYGAELGFELVLACRVTSNPNKPRDFDVVLQSQTGKVVCSDLWTIPVWRLRERTPKAHAVSPREREAIMAAVRRMVGLS